MRAAITPLDPAQITTSPTDREADQARALALAVTPRAPVTESAYAADMRAFSTWCAERGLEALPSTPAAVAEYVAHLDARGRKLAGIARALVAISQAHKARGLESPTADGRVRNVLKNLRRERGSAQTQRAPVLVDDLRAMVRSCPKTLIGLRDRALLTVGFAGAFRRSELVGLTAGDVDQTRDGLVVTLRRSKTDQEGRGRKVGIPFGSDPATCPVRALRAWLEASGVTVGPLLRSVSRHGRVGEGLTAQVVATVVKRACEAAGLDPARYAGHSLRAGLATSAAKAGKSERAIMAQTGHRSTTMVRRYIRDASIFDDNAASGIGL